MELTASGEALCVGKEPGNQAPFCKLGCRELLSSSFKACRQVSFPQITAKSTGAFVTCLLLGLTKKSPES